MLMTCLFALSCDKIHCMHFGSQLPDCAKAPIGKGMTSLLLVSRKGGKNLLLLAGLYCVQVKTCTAASRTSKHIMIVREHTRDS